MLDTIMPRKRATVSWSDNWLLGGFSGSRKTLAGPTVNESLALTCATVWCATRLLSETEACLPLLTYRRGKDNDRDQASNHPLYDLLKNSPNPTMGSTAFREGRMAHMLLWGQGFAEIERDGRGQPLALWPIHPARVQPVLPSDNKPGYTYWVTNNDGTRVPMYADEMLHVPGVISEDGIWGKGVVAYARESIGFDLSTLRHGASYFGSGCQVRGIVTGTGMRDSASRANFRQEFKDIHGSPDSSEIAILPTDAKYQAVTLSAEDNQFLGTRAWNVKDIARWFRVQPHMLMDLDRSTDNNIEAQGLDFIIYSLMPWLHRWEEQIELKLLTKSERGKLFVEHLLAGLLRGDAAARTNAYRTAISIGIMTINECRRLENLNGIGPAGDVNYVPLNMTTAELAMDGPPGPGVQPPGRRPPGSDHTGAGPADQAAAFDRWTRRQLKKSQRQELTGQLLALQKQLADLPQVSREAVRGVLHETLERMFRLEANAAGRIVESRGDFDAWAEQWAGKYPTTLHNALTPSLGLLECLGIRQMDLAARIAAENRQILTASFNSDTREVMTRRLQAWPDRAREVADRILRGEG